jgi:hypothetical protein
MIRRWDLYRADFLRWYSCVMRVANDELAWNATRERLSAGDAHQVLVIEQAGMAGEGIGCSSAPDASIEQFKRSAGQISFQVLAEDAGWVMIAESYDPGWQAQWMANRQLFFRAITPLWPQPSTLEIIKFS